MPPFVLDVDRHAVRRVGALHVADGVVWVMPAGTEALAVVERHCGSCGPPLRGYLIKADGSARLLGAGLSMIASRRAGAAWVLSGDRVHGCAVRLVPSRGVALRVPCGRLAGETNRGLLLGTAGGVLLLDRSTGRVLPRPVGAVAAGIPLGGDLVLGHGADGVLSLVDIATGKRRTLRWPSMLGGLDQVLPQPNGPLVAVGFADPAYPGPQQAEDLFVLDTRTGRFAHVPGFPAQMDLKFSSVAWTSDDRLVMLFRAAGTRTVGVYRPGDRAVSLRRVRLPAPDGGSDSFVPIRTG